MKKIAVLFVLFIAFCGCENSSEPSLEERFSCKVDGKLFVVAEDSDNPISGSRNLSIYYYGETAYSPYYLSIVATGANSQSVSLGCDSVTKTGIYDIFSAKVRQNPVLYEHKEKGTVTISKLDTINKIIAGTFQFTIEDGIGKKLNITEGKFNHSYIPRD